MHMLNNQQVLILKIGPWATIGIDKSEKKNIKKDNAITQICVSITV